MRDKFQDTKYYVNKSGDRNTYSHIDCELLNKCKFKYDEMSNNYKEKLIYQNLKKNKDIFTYQLLLQINKLYRQIPSRILKVQSVSLQIITYNNSNLQGLMRSTQPVINDLGIYSFENYLFHRSDFRNQYFIIPLMKDFNIQFTALVIQNGYTIPRLLFIDQQLLITVKKNLYTFQTKSQMLKITNN